MPVGENPGQVDDDIWRPPQRFGDYILENEIDTGGMGIIYKAYKMPENRSVAVKFMIEQSQYRRFQREASTGRLLHHRNFVRFHDDGEVDGHFYIVMDYIDGKPLKRYMETTNLTSDKRLVLFHKIVSAIAYAHQQGIVHRDLKPGNILVDNENEPVILDFGLVKNMSVSNQEKTALTISGQILGTPGYMSPEQARGEIENQDERSDIFCLGIILYEMLTARNPFPGDNFLEICYNIAHKSAYPINKVLPGIPPQLAKICNDALARRKEDRYQSAQALADDVEDYLRQRQKAMEVPTIKYDVPPYPVEEEHSPAAQPPPAPPLPPQGPMGKILCTSCGSFNSPVNMSCSRCGHSIRKTTSMPKLKGIPTPNQPLQVLVQASPKNIPAAKAQYQGPIRKTPVLKAPMPMPQNFPDAKKPILLTPDREAREQPSRRDLRLHFLIGALLMPVAMMPIVSTLAMPLYCYLLDVLCGAIAEVWLRKSGPRAISGMYSFLALGCAALLIKLLTGGQVFAGPLAQLYVSIELMLLLLLGSSVGMILQRRIVTEQIRVLE